MARKANGLSRKTRRLFLVTLVIIALSPGMLWRSTPAENAALKPVLIRALDVPTGEPLAPGLTIAGGWHLRSDDPMFGGYSALLLRPDGRFLAASDRGRYLRLDKPGEGPLRAEVGPINGADDRDKRLFDVESATQDPRQGTIWLGYEGTNQISRFDSGLGTSVDVRPPAMQRWPSNSGAESMARLADSRFIVLSEALTNGPRPYCEGLLFPEDPVERSDSQSFRFMPPDGFRPTDMAQLPDGRVLILLRRVKLGLPPFQSRLVIADPTTIRAGEEWAWETLADIHAPLPAENYEGLAIEPREDGTVRIWIISDDNSAVFQRTLLLALDWMPSRIK